MGGKAAIRYTDIQVQASSTPYIRRVGIWGAAPGSSLPCHSPPPTHPPLHNVGSPPSYPKLNKSWRTREKKTVDVVAVVASEKKVPHQHISRTPKKKIQLELAQNSIKIREEESPHTGFSPPLPGYEQQQHPQKEKKTR